MEPGISAQVLADLREGIVLGALMMQIHGKIQREGEMVHLIARQLSRNQWDLPIAISRQREVN
jgi:error-prone DNA polymerase